MLTLPPSVQLYVATGPVDARKSFNGLSLYVQSVLRLSPMCGHLFIFFNRRRDQVRILYWDRNGYALWAKRLERGRFALHPKLLEPAGPATIEAAELAMILEGISLAGARRRPRWEPWTGPQPPRSAGLSAPA
jgi:transposase